MAQISSNKCKTCKEDNASLFCYECQFYLCAKCRSFHDQFHNKHTVTESCRIDKSVFATRIKCESHDLEYVHYCKNCKSLTCSTCITTDHKSHEFTDIKEVAASARDDLKKTNCNVKSQQDKLSTQINEIKNIKMKNIQEEINQFIKEARRISDELLRIIKFVEEQNVNRATDFLTNDQQIMNFELAKLETLHKDYSSITDTIDQMIQIEHDMTFYVQQKTLTKDFEATDSIPEVTYPEKIGEFKSKDFIDQVVEIIQSKYSIGCLKKKDDEIAKLQKEMKEEKINISTIKQSHDTAMQNIQQEMTRQSALLQNEKSKIKELENEKRSIQRCSKKKDDEIEKLQNEMKEEKINISTIKQSHDTAMQNIQQEMTRQSALLQNEKRNIQRISNDDIQQLKQEIIKNKNLACKQLQEKEEEIQYAMKSLKVEQAKTTVLEEQKKGSLRFITKKDDEIDRLQIEINAMKSNLTKLKESTDAELEKRKSHSERMQQKAENDLAKLKIDHFDAQIKVKTLTEQRDEVSRKQQGEIDRLKFQVEFMMKQKTMVLPVEVVGLSVCKESFNSCLMLVAIEIGSLYSGCCFSFKGLYKDSERHGFVSPQLYTEGKFQMKIPTALLLNSKKEFECIGVEANKYKKEFVSESWFYFTKFKTMLARSKDKKFEIQMKTSDGEKEMPAVFIYSLTIKYFKDQIKKSMERGTIHEDEVGWIITLPPSANAETQQMMIQAAIEAGISEKHLLVVSETSATVAVCRSENSMPAIQCGARVLVLDLGSGSLDVCVYEVQDDQSLNIHLNASFPAVGLPQVHKAFEDIFIGIVGNTVFEKYCKEYPEERKKWLGSIFQKICSQQEGLKQYIHIELPIVLKEVLHNETGDTFRELLCKSKFSNSLNCTANGKLKISLPVWHQLFDIPVQEIKYYVNQVTEMGGMESINNIIITGGIMQSDTIQLRIKRLFPKKHIIIPKDVGFSVLRGAIAIGMS